MKLKITLVILSVSIGTYALAHETSDRVHLTAQAAYVYDLAKNRVLFRHNEKVQLPLASLTKLMTVYVSHRHGFGDYVTSCFTLITSSNKHAEEIASHLVNPVERLNATANVLGMRQTFYLNATGLDISPTLAGAYGSARDQAMLLVAFYNEYSDILDCTRNPDSSLDGTTLPNTNPDVTRTVGLIGSKTGSTDLAGGNLAVIFDAEIDRPVVVIVLGSTSEDRFRDVALLVDYTLDNLKQ